MADEIRYTLEKMYREHRATTVGMLTGLLIGAMILLLGFFNTLFLFACIGVGLYVGLKLDKGEGDDFLKILDRLPERFRH